MKSGLLEGLSSSKDENELQKTTIRSLNSKISTVTTTLLSLQSKNYFLSETVIISEIEKAGLKSNVADLKEKLSFLRRVSVSIFVVVVFAIAIYKILK